MLLADNGAAARGPVPYAPGQVVRSSGAVLLVSSNPPPVMAIKACLVRLLFDELILSAHDGTP